MRKEEKKTLSQRKETASHNDYLSSLFVSLTKKGVYAFLGSFITDPIMFMRYDWLQGEKKKNRTRVWRNLIKRESHIYIYIYIL